MKSLLTLTAFVIFCSVTAFGQFEGSKEIYSSPKLKDAVANQKIVAILPFSASITYKHIPKNYNDSANKSQEKDMTTSLQSSMYTFLLRKSDKYSVTFQDVDRTNALLKQAGVFDNLDAVTQDSICKILKVDAVIKCKYAYEKTASQGAAIATTVLFGSLGSKTGSGALTMQIYNGADGELLWRFYKALTEGLFNSSDQVIEHMMRKVSRNFPYDK